MKIAKLFFGLACMAAFAACTNDDELLTNEVSQPHAMSFTLSTGADTRTALAEPTDKTGTYSLSRTWKEGDAVEVCYSADDGSTMTHETFTLTAGAGTTSGTFSNDESNIPTTGEVKLNIITKAGSFFYYSDEGSVTIFNQGDGSIATVGNYEIIVWYDVAVTDGVWNFPEPVVMTSILHLPAGFPVYEAASSDVEATADLVLFTYGDNSDFAFTFPDGPLAVSVNIVEDNKLSLTGIKLKGGQLATDVYMAVFPGAVDSNISLNFTVIEEGEKGKEYTVKLKDPTSWLEAGNVYHLDAADIVEEEVIGDPLTIEPISDNITVTISNPLGLTIEYAVAVIGDETLSSFSSATIEIPVKVGERLQLFGDNATYFSGTQYTNINCSAESKVYGNIMSLIDSDDYDKATTLEQSYNFAALFFGNKCLTDASGLLLPANTLTESCYAFMFQNCTALKTAPELTANTLKDNCYRSMFYGCTSLTTAPELKASTLASGCYHSMFYGCTNLTTAPELPATTLTEGCYNSMFFDCTSLTTAPELPATTLARACYYNMFNGCTSLTTAPELKASTLERSCYAYMLSNCTSLTTAPELPATITTGAEYCYAGMFKGCTSLTTTPELKTSILVDGCYYNMFNGCTSLNAVTCLAANISATDCTTDWLDGVSPTGTFTKASGMTSWGIGTSGIPSGWTQKNYGESELQSSREDNYGDEINMP